MVHSLDCVDSYGNCFDILQYIGGIDGNSGCCAAKWVLGGGTVPLREGCCASCVVADDLHDECMAIAEGEGLYPESAGTEVVTSDDLVTFLVIQENVDCSSSDERLGFFDLQGCADACYETTGCEYFEWMAAFDGNDNDCWYEHTTIGCTGDDWFNDWEGWTFYQIAQ